MLQRKITKQQPARMEQQKITSQRIKPINDSTLA